MRSALVLVAVLAVVGCDAQQKTTSFESPRGTITYKQRVLPDAGAFEGSVRAASGSELARLSHSAGKAKSLIANYVPATQTSSDLLENLDLAFSGWLKMSKADKESPAEVESIIGAALGQYSIERLPVRWAVVRDSVGTEFALVGDDPPTKAFPLASVRNRIEDRKTDFIGALYESYANVRRPGK